MKKRHPHVAGLKRRFVYDRDGHACVVCGSMNKLTIDHIEPVCLGGGSFADNLMTLCMKCNQHKGDLPVSHWIPTLRSMVEVDRVLTKLHELRMEYESYLKQREEKNKFLASIGRSLHPMPSRVFFCLPEELENTCAQQLDLVG